MLKPSDFREQAANHKGHNHSNTSLFENMLLKSFNG